MSDDRNKEFNLTRALSNAGEALSYLFNTSNPDEVHAAFGFLNTWYHIELAKWVPERQPEDKTEAL